MRIPVGVVVGAVLAAIASAVPVLLRRKDPKERERRRRELVTEGGRTIEGCAVDCTEQLVVYTYEWRGVRYEASQDISDFITMDASTFGISGPVTVKFLPRAPANSIIVAEKWSGLPGVLHRNALR